MAIELPLTADQNTVGADLDAAYLRLLDVEPASQSGIVRLPFYCYHDKTARERDRQGKRVIAVKQGTEMVSFSEFATEFMRELTLIGTASPEKAPGDVYREAHFKAGYAILKTRGFSGVDC